MVEETEGVDAVVEMQTAVQADRESLDQPEDEATEHALRLMDEALRRNGAGWRWLVAGDP